MKKTSIEILTIIANIAFIILFFGRIIYCIPYSFTLAAKAPAICLMK